MAEGPARCPRCDECGSGGGGLCATCKDEAETWSRDPFPPFPWWVGAWGTVVVFTIIAGVALAVMLYG